MKIQIKIALGLFMAHFSVKAQSIELNPSDTKSILKIESTSQGLKLPVLSEAQRNLIAAPVIGMEVYCNNCLAGVGPYTYNGTAWSPSFVPPSSDLPSYTVGQSAQGGKVFFVDETGRHGLAAATIDQSTGNSWFNANFQITGATASGIYAGINNTSFIIEKEGNGNYAAKSAQNYNGGNFGDWYLPSLEELRLMYTQKSVIGGFSNAIYWSSTEIPGSPASNPSINASAKNFTDGAESNTSKSNSYRVRAIRKF